jgi:hypothetical protein
MISLPNQQVVNPRIMILPNPLQKFPRSDIVLNEQD